jgi:hypothetical protein
MRWRTTLPNNRMQLTRSAPLQGRLAPPSQLIRVLGGQMRGVERRIGLGSAHYRGCRYARRAAVSI